MIATAFQGGPDDVAPTVDDVNAILQTFFIKGVNAFDPREALILQAFHIDPTWAIPNVIVADPLQFVQLPSAALRTAANGVGLILP